jgi:hypothetical protein
MRTLSPAIEIQFMGRSSSTDCISAVVGRQDAVRLPGWNAPSRFALASLLRPVKKDGSAAVPFDLVNQLVGKPECSQRKYVC